MKKLMFVLLIILFATPALASDCEPKIEKAVWENVEIYRISSLGSIEYRDDLYTAFGVAYRLKEECESIRLASGEAAREIVIELVRKGVIQPKWKPVSK